MFGGGGGGGDNNPWPEVYKKNLSGHRVQFKKTRLDLQVTLKIDLKVMMYKVMYSITFHRLVKHLERLFSPKIQDNPEKGHLVVSQTFDLNFFTLLRSQKPFFHKSLHLIHLTLKIDLKVKIYGTVKCPSRSWSTFVRTFFSWIKYFRRYLGL